jgi:hypothetical protein
MNPQLNIIPKEDLPIYTLTEEFNKSTKSITFTTDHMDEIFSETLDFLKYIGFTDEMLANAFDNYQKGFI